MIVVWRITEHCNLTCKFCGFDRDLPRPRREADPQGILAFGALLAEYQLKTGDAVLVSWLGGEPLLWPPLTDLTRAFRTNYGLAISTTTNGTSLRSSAVRAHLLEHYSELTISVDAIGALHDQLRGWPGGYASLRRDVTALAQEKRARAHGPMLRANVLLMRQTLAGFEQLCGELAGWGIEEITFNQLGGNDRPEFYPAHRLLPEQAQRLAAELPRMRRESAARGLRLHGGEGYQRRIQATALGERLAVHDCQPGRRFVFIDELGRIAPCSFTSSAYGVPASEVKCVEDLCQLPVRFAELRQHPPAVSGRAHRSAGFQTCRIAGFQTRSSHDLQRAADLEVGDTAGLETCATIGVSLQQQSPPCEDCHSTQVFEKFIS
jgi:AdoMet-dependent heme synthase